MKKCVQEMIIFWDSLSFSAPVYSRHLNFYANPTKKLQCRQTTVEKTLYRE